MEQPSIFPQGYESEDFHVYILVRVDDYIGSYSDLELSVRVRLSQTAISCSIVPNSHLDLFQMFIVPPRLPLAREL